MTQPDLFDGARLKKDGMYTVLEHTPESWKEAFRHAGESMALHGMEFTSEDILERVGSPPNSPNAVGAAMNGLARSLKLKRLRYEPARKRSRHAAVVAVWKL